MALLLYRYATQAGSAKRFVQSKVDMYVAVRVRTVLLIIVYALYFSSMMCCSVFAALNCLFTKIRQPKFKDNLRGSLAITSMDSKNLYKEEFSFTPIILSCSAVLAKKLSQLNCVLD